MPPGSPHLASPVELKERLEAEREGVPFLVFRSGEGAQRIVRLRAADRDLTIGRSAESDISLDWDGRVSALHAELQRAGGHWLVVDDGLSRNGTYLNGERVAGRHRLRDGDQLTIGRTDIVFRAPIQPGAESTIVGRDAIVAPELSPAPRRVLVSLCRPYRDGTSFARPATNQQIADELHLTVAAVKSHLRLLFHRFGLENLPQNEKRARLVHVALESGAVTPSDLKR